MNNTHFSHSCYLRQDTCFCEQKRKKKKNKRKSSSEAKQKKKVPTSSPLNTIPTTKSNNKYLL